MKTVVPETLIPDDLASPNEDVAAAHTAVMKQFKSIRDEFESYVRDRTEGSSQYTSSPKYLNSTIEYHTTLALLDFQRWLNNRIQGTVVDVGCATGVVGLSLAHRGLQVTFHDFEGIGLEFIRYYANKHRLDYRVIPYGQEIEQHDWAIAQDVLEHTPNPLTFLRWIAGLGRNVFLTYPLSVEYQPPFASLRTDEFVDDLAVKWVLEKRHEIFLWHRLDGRRFVGFRS